MATRVLIIISIILVSLGYSVYQSRELNQQLSLKSENILKTIPETSFQTLDGKSFHPLNDLSLTSQDLVIVHFWGTWCAPCEAELPSLLSFVTQLNNLSSAGKNITYILVAVNDEVKKVKKKISSFPQFSSPNLLWLLDSKGVHKNAYGTTRVPETYVFSASGQMLKKFVGPQEWTKPFYTDLMKELFETSRSDI